MWANYIGLIGISMPHKRIFLYSQGFGSPTKKVEAGSGSTNVDENGEVSILWPLDFKINYFMLNFKSKA